MGAGSHGALRSRIIRHSLPSARSGASSMGLLMPRSSSSGVALGFDRDDLMEEEGSYLEPIRLQQQQAAMWAVPNSRPLSSASLISNSSSPISPSATGGGGGANNLYANNEALLAAAAASNHHHHHHHHQHEGGVVVANDPMGFEPLLVPPPGAYMNNVSASQQEEIMADADDESQQHVYINVGPDALEVSKHNLFKFQLQILIHFFLSNQTKGPRQLELITSFWTWIKARIRQQQRQ